MKRAVILILVLALLVGVGYIGFASKSPTAEAAKADYELVVIAENQ